MKYIENIKKFALHVKRNASSYIILGVLVYVLYQVYKMVSDTGLKDGDPYYKEFDESESESEETANA